MSDKTNTFLESFKQALTDDGAERIDYFAGKAPPTKSPFINELIGAGLAVMEGRINEEQYRKTVDLTTYRLEESLKIFMDYFNLQELPDNVKSEATNAMSAFNDQKAALADLEEYFKDKDKSHIIAGNEKTITAAGTLITSYENLGSIGREYFKVECLKCGHRNSPENKFCEGCKAEIILPKATMATSFEMSFNDVNDMPPNFAFIFQAVEKLKTGEIASEEFGATLDQFLGIILAFKPNMEKILQDDIKGIQAEVVGEDLLNHFREYAEQMLASIEETAAGLTRMKGFVTSGDQGDIASGWDRMLAGGREMQRVTKAMSELMARESEAMQAEAAAAAPPAVPEESVTIRGEDE